jgi:5-(carboxyamino)imidazole ribonucleotide mutase
VDSLLAIVQMPPGIPVATVAIGDAGAKNAAYLAAQIIGLGRAEVADKYQAVRDGFVAAAREQ